MANKTNERAKIRARFEAMLNSKRFPVNVVDKSTVVLRNERGHPTGSKTVYVLEGHGVSNPFKRTYFRDTRVDPLAKEGIDIKMPRVKKGSGQVVVELTV